MKFIKLTLFFLVLFLVTQVRAQTNGEQMSQLRESLERQSTMLRRLQTLMAEQINRQDVLEQSKPPDDLLESLYSDLKRMQQDLQNIWPRLVAIEEQMDNQWSQNLNWGNGDLTSGILALLAGDPDSATIYFEKFLAED